MTTVTAFDADVLIYAATKDHPFGSRIVALLGAAEAGETSIGSVLLVPEVLTKPMRHDRASAEIAALVSLLGRLRLRPFDEPTARLSLALAVNYGLRAADAAHLATAVAAQADRFLTNNRKGFPRTVSEIAVIYPEDLPGLPA